MLISNTGQGDGAASMAAAPEVGGDDQRVVRLNDPRFGFILG
jgi:hypothetical protein